MNNQIRVIKHNNHNNGHALFLASHSITISTYSSQDKPADHGYNQGFSETNTSAYVIDDGHFGPTGDRTECYA